MLFSVIVPVFNTEKYLRKCFESILSQDFGDYELIIVDDGSNDGSPEICDEYGEKFNALGKVGKAKVIHQRNEGLAGARNRGIKEASGEWLWFVDSDDYIVSGALSTISERMLLTDGDLYSFQYIKTDEAGENPEYIFFRAFQERVRIKNEGDLYRNYTERILNYKEGWETWSRLFKKSIIDKNSLEFKNTNEVFAEDVCFLTEYMMFIEIEIRLVNYLYCYRQRESSIMRSLDQKTVFPRLINLLDDVLNEAIRLRKKQIVKRFSEIVRAFLVYQIRYKFENMTDDELCSEIEASTKRIRIGRIIGREKETLLKAAKGERNRKDNL